ncbi:McrB family protein [Pectobacterium brasiliense]|uniref:McrB family protein n=1 Tax=Pectobacterium brasiliense TaxID=180957 RepID=UPI001F289E4C|nr:AAA family ATPase [Pectobacterium brasiliense]
MDIIAQVEKKEWSLGALINKLYQYSREKYPKWENNYRDLVNAAQAASAFTTPETDELLQRLWYVRDNGIANIRQGGLSLAEFERNLPLFRSITEQIRLQPNEDTYWKITREMVEAKEDGRLNKMYYALRNRVFAAFMPRVCTTTVDYKAFNETAAFLNTCFTLGLQAANQRSWLQVNHDLTKELAKVSIPVDVFQINMAVWGLRELLNQRKKALEYQGEEKNNQYFLPHENKEITVSSPFNKIFFGPPGTGKTYTLQQEMAAYTTQAISKDDGAWLDSRLAPLSWMQITALVLLDLNKKAKVRQLTEHVWFQRKALLNRRSRNLPQTAWSELQAHTIPESTTVDYKSRREPAIFDKTANSEWLLVESQLEQIDDVVTLYDVLKRGPEQGEKIHRYSTVTFHQSYGYEEFIQGIRARSDDDGNVFYSTEQGVFLQLCDRAKADPEHRYAIFIDEINRGNISKIFGELIALIETDKRAGMKNALSLQLATSESEERFSVPANVDIIGAMNTADRSLALMDTALRRRFEFVEMMPDLSLLSGVKVKGIKIESLLEKLNSRIEALYDREHTLGHAFFIPVKTALEEKGEDDAFKVFQAVFQKKIIPLLQEYFFDDWNKIRLVLADNQKKNDGLRFITEKVDALDELFGDDHGLRRHNQKSTSYELKGFHQDDFWDEPLAYRAIYEPKVAEISGSDERNG